MVGVPDIMPTELRDNPDGSVPEAIVQLKGAVPPVETSVCEYTTPTVQAGNELVVILSTGFIVSDIDSVAVVLLLSATWIVTEIGPPTVVGVPEIMPLELSDNPVGSAPEVIVHV